jgi:hypothetical protein
MEDKRKSDRRPVVISTVIRKQRPEGGHAVMELKTGNISLGGVFVSTEDLSIMDLGDELEILVDADREKYYEGRARVVRSARAFSDEGTLIESGFGLMFLDPDETFRSMLSKQVED